MFGINLAEKQVDIMLDWRGRPSILENSLFGRRFHL